jgi:hypothetical protein
MIRDSVKNFSPRLPMFFQGLLGGCQGDKQGLNDHRFNDHELLHTEITDNRKIAVVWGDFS